MAIGSEKPTSRRIVELLRSARHPSKGGEWATFSEVRNGTGWAADKTCYLDLFAMNCWPSKKFRSLAYEVKVDRADFMREILNPSKRSFAEEVAMECWFAVPTGLVTVDEVPEGWGLVQVSPNGKLKTLKMPQQRVPKPWGMEFIATLLRKASDPDSKVSEALWTLAGKEVTEAQLLDAMDEKVKAMESKIRAQEAIAAKKNMADQVAGFEKRIHDLHTREERILAAIGLDPERTRFLGEEDLLALVKTPSIKPHMLHLLRALHRDLGDALVEVVGAQESVAPAKDGTYGR